ncbi:MAG: acyltransferase family protein [Pseudomonadota bacterium]
MSSTPRLHYLDNLRVFCMLFGILVQTNRLYEAGPWMVFLDMSGFFRMASFFAVSGFFAAMLYHRREVKQFFRHRAVAILVPLAFGLLVLNPLTISLITSFHEPSAPRLGFFEALSGLWGERAGYSGPASQVLHLWFLIGLAFYVAMTPMVIFALRHVGAFVARKVHLPHATWPFAVSVSVMLLVLLARLVDEMLGRAFGESSVTQEIVMFAPYFFLGICGYMYRSLWSQLHKIDLTSIIAAAILMTTYHVGFKDTLSPASTMMHAAAESMATMATVFALLWAFRRWVDFETATTRFLSDGIYTAYILQILLIYAFGSVLALLGVPVQWMYWPVVFLTFFAGYAFYHWVVAQNSVLTLLFKGRLPDQWERGDTTERA